MAVHGGHSIGEAIQADFHDLIDATAYVIVPVLLVMLALRTKLQNVGQMLWPSDGDLRLVAVAFWATLLLPTLPALFWGVEIHAIWSMSMWTLLSVLLLSPLPTKIPRPPVQLIVGTAIGFPLVMHALCAGSRTCDPDQRHRPRAGTWPNVGQTSRGGLARGNAGAAPIHWRGYGQ
jgi:hypothetical protein